MIGKLISHYRIVEPLGAGGMGVVYRAEDVELGRSVALKFRPPQFSADPESRDRFTREARAASALDHPNICTVHDRRTRPAAAPRWVMALLAFMTLVVHPAVAQDAPHAELTGRVVDAETGLPLPLAHVFLDGTSIGDVTADDGSFRLARIPYGPFELVVSMIGFERYQEDLHFGAQPQPPIEIRLTEAVIMNEDVVVIGERDNEWKRQLALFTRAFIGTTELAKDCRIMNPEVLSFADDPESGGLVATASEPLRIANRALGYDVVFLLDRFRGHAYSLEYQGKVSFEERTPGSAREARRWADRRRQTWMGSVRHFLRSAAADRLFEEGFKVIDVANPGSMETGFPPRDMVIEDRQMDAFALRFPHYIRIEYDGEGEAWEYVDLGGKTTTRSRDPRGRQISWLTLRAGTTYFTRFGRMLFPMSVVLHGYWGWEERVANMLPWDYLPDGE